MSRQVLTVPDIPPQFLTETEGNGLYALSAHNHDPAYVNVTGDTMTGTLTLTPGAGVSSLDARARVDIQNPAGTASLRIFTGGVQKVDVGATGTLTLTPDAGQYALDAKAAINVASPAGGWIFNATVNGVQKTRIDQLGTLTLTSDAGQPSLQANSWLALRGNVGGAPSAKADRALQFYDAGGENWSGMGTDVNGRPWLRMGINDAGGGRWEWATDGSLSAAIQNGVVVFSVGVGGRSGNARIGSNAANSKLEIYGTGCEPFTDNYLHLGNSDRRWTTVYTSQVSAGGSGALVLGTVSSLQFSFSGYGHPLTDNTMNLGHPSYRWGTIYVVSAPVVGSSADLKERFARLDPRACADAVLETDWLSFDYKPLHPSPRREDDERPDAEREAAHRRVLEETAFSRHQKGYALGSSEFRVHDLFGLPDRKSRSDGADLAVVACALQDALKRIAQLEAARG